MRNEDPPNKEVHASDLANALASLKTEQSGFGNESGNASGRYANDPDTPVSMTSNRTASWNVSGQRSRSSTLIYHPGDHGMSPNLPAVLVEDMSGTAAVDGDVDMSPIEMQSQDQGLGNVQKLPPKTARPPVELMEC